MFKNARKEEHNGIAFLDCSSGKPIDLNRITFLSPTALAEKIQKDTNRELILQHKSGKINFHPSVGILKLPDPIGYTLFTFKKIIVPRGAKVILCNYGGNIVSLASIKNPGSSYIFGITKDRYIDATEVGEVGSVLMHLPQPDALKNLGYEGPLCQQQNVSEEMTPEGKLIFFITKSMPAGLILGYDYGNKYWPSLNRPFALISPDGSIIADNKITYTNPIVVFDDGSSKENAGVFRWYEPYSDLVKDNHKILCRNDGKSDRTVYTTMRMVNLAIQDNPGKPVVSVPTREITAEMRNAERRGEKRLLLPTSFFAKSPRDYGPYRDYYMLPHFNPTTQEYEPDPHNYSKLNIVHK